MGQHISIWTAVEKFISTIGPETLGVETGTPAFIEGLRDRRADIFCVVLGHDVREVGFVADRTACHRPNERLVTAVVLFDPGLLFNHLRAVQTQAGFTGHHELRAESGRNRHAAETPDRASHDADNRG